MLRAQIAFSEYLHEFEHAVASNLPPETAAVHSLKKQIIEAELIVPVIGAFSAGKSTLINALLGSSLLPVGIAPETELATELRYAEKEHLLGIRPDGSEERFPVEALAEVNRRSSEFLFLRAYINNAALKAITPLVLVDMPGFGSSLDNHNKALSFYMPRGVHFIVVTSVEDGTVTRSMLRQLDQLRKYNTKFTFFLSKANLRHADQAGEVQRYIEEQLEMHAWPNTPVTPVSLEDGHMLSDALRALNPEGMFSDLFLDKLKEHNLETIEQINTALHALQQESHQREEHIAELNHALEKLRTQRDEAVSKARGNFSKRAQGQCIKRVDEALHEALDDLATIAMRNNSKALSSALLEEVQQALGNCIDTELNSAASTFVDNISDRLSLASEGVLAANNADWAKNIGIKVSSALHQTRDVVGNWQATLGKDAASKAGGLYKTISTMLSVTTKVLHPVVELLIIFLPDILGFFSQRNEQSKVREALLNEIFPDIKAELRKALPDVLEQELHHLLNSIAQEFETQISKQQQIIASIHAEHSAGEAQSTAKRDELEALRTTVQKLANQYLYASSGV